MLYIVMTICKCAVVTILLLIASVYDVKTKKIPPVVSYIAMGSGLIFCILSRILSYINTSNMIWSFGASLILLIIMGFVPIMGGGDAKMLIALFLWDNPLTILIMFGIANVLVGCYLIYKNLILVKFVAKKKLKGEKVESFGRLPMLPSFFITYIGIYIYTFIKMFTNII